MTAIRVKTCGLSTDEAVTAAAECGADFLGFIFYAPSPRNVEPEKAARLAALAPSIPAVAVTVDADDTMLATIFAAFKPSVIQLHGAETPARVAEIKSKFGIPVIKAMAIRNAEDVKAAHAYEEVADMLMFDAKGSGPLPGGNGVAFDWQLLAGQRFGRTWFLSGGLNAQNVEQAVRISGAKLLDVSSGIESAPGIKSPAMIHEFLKTSKHVRV